MEIVVCPYVHLVTGGTSHKTQIKHSLPNRDYIHIYKILGDILIGMQEISAAIKFSILLQESCNSILKKFDDHCHTLDVRV